MAKGFVMYRICNMLCNVCLVRSKKSLQMRGTWNKWSSLTAGDVRNNNTLIAYAAGTHNPLEIEIAHL